MSPPLLDHRVNIKVRLALLWTCLMFLYIYADYFELMTPGKIEKMMELETPMGPTKPGLLVIFSVMLIIPALMIVFSVFLKPWLNRWVNISFAIIYSLISILIIMMSFHSEWHGFYVLFNVVELVVLGVIIVQAWGWPREGS